MITNEYVALEQISKAGKIAETAKDLESNMMHNFMGASRSKYFTQNVYNTTKRLVPTWFLRKKNHVPAKVGKKPGRNEINPATGKKFKFS